jgi:DNA-binding MarR family transcriptional regulator
MAAKKQQIEPYLKISYRIFNITKLKIPEKVLLAHIYSFGEKGCWEGNETIGKIFFVSARTVSRWIETLKKTGLILWLHPKGRYRTIWAKTNPKVE